jgi:hypothetical protein
MGGKLFWDVPGSLLLAALPSAIHCGTGRSVVDGHSAPAPDRQVPAKRLVCGIQGQPTEFTETGPSGEHGSRRAKKGIRGQGRFLY